VPINELCQIDGTHKPGRFLSAQPERFAWEQSGRSATARFLMTKSEVLGGDLSSGMFASPNSARRPKNVLCMGILGRNQFEYLKATSAAQGCETSHPHEGTEQALDGA
jgi:hypothetical protein